jgi:hypothetical protein
VARRRKKSHFSRALDAVRTVEPMGYHSGCSTHRVDPGVRLDPYEIVSLVGAGGMGEVYKGIGIWSPRTSC